MGSPRRTRQVRKLGSDSGKPNAISCPVLLVSLLPFQETLFFISPSILWCRERRVARALQNPELCSSRSLIKGREPHLQASPPQYNSGQMRTLLLPGPAGLIARPPRSDSAGTAHRTVLAPRRSPGSDTQSWCRWSSADTDDKCYPEGRRW